MARALVRGVGACIVGVLRGLVGGLRFSYGDPAPRGASLGAGAGACAGEPDGTPRVRGRGAPPSGDTRSSGWRVSSASMACSSCSSGTDEDRGESRGGRTGVFGDSCAGASTPSADARASSASSLAACAAESCARRNFTSAAWASLTNAISTSSAATRLLRPCSLRDSPPVGVSPDRCGGEDPEGVRDTLAPLVLLRGREGTGDSEDDAASPAGDVCALTGAGAPADATGWDDEGPGEGPGEDEGPGECPGEVVGPGECPGEVVGPGECPGEAEGPGDTDTHRTSFSASRRALRARRYAATLADTLPWPITPVHSQCLTPMARAHRVPSRAAVLNAPLAPGGGAPLVRIRLHKTCT